MARWRRRRRSGRAGPSTCGLPGIRRPPRPCIDAHRAGEEAEAIDDRPGFRRCSTVMARLAAVQRFESGEGFASRSMRVGELEQQAGRVRPASCATTSRTPCRRPRRRRRPAAARPRAGRGSVAPGLWIEHLLLASRCPATKFRADQHLGLEHERLLPSSRMFALGPAIGVALARQVVGGEDRQGGQRR